MVINNFMHVHRGTFTPFPNFKSCLIPEFGDIPVPPAYVLSLKKASGVLFTSTYESLVWAFRRAMLYAILGMKNTAENVDKISYTPCPIPTTESYKTLEMDLG